jgi:HlyD family secretion protein
VFVVEGAIVRRREVELGARGPFEAELKGGLEAGETVVHHPSDRLGDGVRVWTP